MRNGYLVFVGAAALALLAVLAAHPPGGDRAPVAALPSTAQPAIAASPAPPEAATPAAPRPAPGPTPLKAPATPAASPAVQPAAATATPRPAAQAAAGGGDALQGRAVFRKCAVCHSLDPGKNLQGPSLAGVVGRKSGEAPNFSYSDAMKKAGLTWSAATLDAYLTDPQKLVPGNRMPFPGLKSQHDRDDVIAYLAAPPGQMAAMPGMVHGAGNPEPAASAAAPDTATPEANLADVRYTLRTGIAEGRMVYIGVGGTIDGEVDPTLSAAEGQGVAITLINGEGAEHDIIFPDQDATSPRITGKGASTTIAFRAGKAGEFAYFCSAPGHRLAGMEGKFRVTPKPPAPATAEADISRDPSDLPPPIGERAPQTVRVDLEAREIEGRLAEGTTFGFWTFNGKVPGPMLRVRVGDTVDIHLKNAADSSMIHSVDFHAVTGPGGGAAALQVNPGDEKSMTWKALVPGLYVYHCATPMVAEHIANGMYGMILVEPEDGLPKVDHEFYVMQGEIYTDAPFGQRGSQEFSVEKLLDEHPEYFVFNGSVGALSVLHPLKAKVGETVRIYFGVGGPNFTSSFHVIGEILDKVYEFGGFTSAPLRGLQTVSVAPGGAVAVEFKPLVPGNYVLVDHALARMERGLAGILKVEGAPNPEIYDGKVMPGMGH